MIKMKVSSLAVWSGVGQCSLISCILATPHWKGLSAGVVHGAMRIMWASGEDVWFMAEGNSEFIT